MSRILIVCGGSGVNLLGQRQALGIDAELQVDVSSERRVATGDPYAHWLALDSAAGTSNELLAVAQKNSTYSGACAEHLKFLHNFWIDNKPLRDGLARSPALAGLAIRQPIVAAALRNTLRTMLVNLTTPLGQQNPLDVWIVSSTAGGTGEGTHRFVAETLVALVTSMYQQTDVKVSFVRIGPGTYQAIDFQRTSLNTFFGIAADSAFALRIPQQYHRASFESYYMDLPDVGTGEAAKPIRAQIVEMAAKAVMLDELSQDLARLTVNQSMSLVRVGFWRRDFDEDEVYLETLQGVSRKLQDLLDPNSVRYLAAEAKPKIQVEGLSSSADEYREDAEADQFTEARRNIRPFLADSSAEERAQNAGWKFPRLMETPPPDDRRLAEELIPAWMRSISELLRTLNAPVRDLNELRVKIVARKSRSVEGETQHEDITLSPPALPSHRRFDLAWFEAVDETHFVKAWCDRLLSEYRTRLLQLAQQCFQDQYQGGAGTTVRARAQLLAQHLPDFCFTLQVVRYLLSQRSRAEAQINEVKAELAQLQQRILSEIQRRGLVNGQDNPKVAAAELWDPLDRVQRQTWLYLLYSMAQRNERRRFENAVRQGATGLTETGLLNLLNLRSEADVEVIREQLEQKAGQITDLQGNVRESVWWQNKKPVETLKFQFQIFPRLDGRLRHTMGSRYRETQYVFTPLGAIGLSVMAVDAISIAPPFDLVTTPAFLMSPFLPTVYEALQDWTAARPVKPTGRMYVAAAAPVCEPLFADLLQELQLGDTATDRIKEFYELYTP